MLSPLVTLYHLVSCVCVMCLDSDTLKNLQPMDDDGKQYIEEHMAMAAEQLGEKGLEELRKSVMAEYQNKSNNEESNTGQSASSSFRIVGGSQALRGEFPYLVRLYRTTHYGIEMCGASLITERWVVSAAHCTQPYDVDFWNVIAGDYEDPIETSEQKTKFSSIYNHPEYSKVGIWKYDISIGKTIDKFEFNLYVKPIKLAKYEPHEGHGCYIAGWGDKYENISKEGRALNKGSVYKATVVITSQETCEKYWGKGRNRICTWNPPHVVMPCHGDSGGPLACWSTEEDSTILAGVISFSPYGCGAALNLPAAYANVAYVNDWLTKIIAEK